ncbi:MAG: sel1 repeat family protein [Planctomycetes bacterium]|nr:sel1 repeat family protein [Planctomycetota bacterium]
MLIVVLFGFLLVPRVQQDVHVVQAFAGTASALLVWQLVLWLLARRSGRRLAVEFVPPVRQHYIQACVQLCLYAYWGFFWRPIYAQAPLILAQLVFLFAFDALFSWSRGRAWRLSSGPAPIVLSTNLFIWFRDDWFVLQFVMVTVGLLGKEFLKWQKEGRRTHIFNPSGFGLLVAAIALLSTGMTEQLTLARYLASTIESPPYIFLFLFCLGLVVQHFFAVTLMTLAAAVVIVAIDTAHTQVTGTYLFITSNLPAAGFLGLLLLMTDPSTSPRTNLGRALFGAGYGLGYVLMFELLGDLGAPELYAKLFPVPILNLTVRWLDRLARSGWTGRLNTRWETALAPRRTNLVHITIWATIFLSLQFTGHLSEPHPGHEVGFWKRAFAEGRLNAPRKLRNVAGQQAESSPDFARPEAVKKTADAANERGILRFDELPGEPAATRYAETRSWFIRAVAFDSQDACANLLMLYLWAGQGEPDNELKWVLQRLDKVVAEAPTGAAAFLLGLANETGRGVPPNRARALELYRGCGPDDVFAVKGIARLGLAATGAFVNLDGVEPVLAGAAAAGDGESCWYLAHMYANGRGVARDAAKAQAMRERACELGFAPACEARQAAALPPFEAPPIESMRRPPWATAYPL